MKAYIIVNQCNLRMLAIHLFHQSIYLVTKDSSTVDRYVTVSVQCASHGSKLG